MKKYFVLLILLTPVLLLSFSIYFPKDYFNENEVIFAIEKGRGSKEISADLQRANLIWWGPSFRAYVYIRGFSKNLQAGAYRLSPSMSIIKIADKFAAGEVEEMNVTIPEGFTVKQIEERLGLKLPGENLEGFLFPDTYRLKSGITGEEAARIMQDNFDKKIAPHRSEIAQSGKTVFEIITMASLLEKEVKTIEDKELVSGILWKRVRAGMPLQVDAAILYITGKNTTQISIEETKIDSPYNTYKYRGLPAGPISNPGLESILAAIYPKSSSYWYYLSTPEGKTIFSKTLEEHNIAKAKYLK
jgi:UPF0755 protein